MPRNLAAYIGRQRDYQRDYEEQRQDERQQQSSAAAVSAAHRSRREAAASHPDYGCVEWYMYERRRA